MSFDFSTLITDRTEADVLRLQQLSAKGINGMTSEELAEWNGSEIEALYDVNGELLIDANGETLMVLTKQGYGHKGGYNASDLNRVTAAMEYLDGILSEMGYVTGYTTINIPHQDGTTDTRWREDDESWTVGRRKIYFQNVAALWAQFKQLPSTPAPPTSTEPFLWTSANNIEKILLDIEVDIKRLSMSRFYAGEIYCGEV